MTGIFAKNIYSSMSNKLSRLSDILIQNNYLDFTLWVWMKFSKKSRYQISDIWKLDNCKSQWTWMGLISCEMRIQKIFVHIVLLLVVVRLELHSSLYGNNPLVNRPYRFFWTGPICTFQGSLTTFFLKHIASLNLKYKGEQVSYYTGAPECPKSWWGQALIN